MSNLGRPRSDAAQSAILEAALRILMERGFDGMSIEAVAEAAGVAKTTIYRRWPGKAELAVEAFFTATKDELRLPQTTSARADFATQITELGRLLQGPRGAVLAAMLGGARTDPVLSRALGERFLAPRRKWGFERMMQAQAQGQLRPGVKIGAALALLYGPVYTPLLFGEPVPDLTTLQDILALSLNAIFQPDSP
jgi:AcrR family transcriptional regulator